MRRIAILTVLISIAAAAIAPLMSAEQPIPARESEAAKPAKTFSPQQVQFFERTVRPILANKCFECHGPQKQESGLRLDSRAALLTGGDNGPGAVPGKPEASLFVRAIRRKDGLEMPPDRALEPQEVEALARWAEMGLPWPETPKLHADDAKSNWKSHWAYRPIANPPVPEVKEASWAQTSIDRFVQARLEQQNIMPSPPADRGTLIRRASFDLLGLPPTPEEVDAFANDPSPDAFATVVDRLLASPHYGERWGRYWLDVARYADNKGYVFFEEPTFPWAYTYRDYVVESFNNDLPFDRFVLEQLAADRLVADTDQRPLRALGFLTLGAHFMNNVHDIIDDRIDVVSRGLLGLTVTCARCHDHKYDPIPQDEYYGLYGVFSNSQEPSLPPTFVPPPETEESRKFLAEMRAREKKLSDFATTTVENIERTARERVADYLMAVHARRHQPSSENFMLLADKGDLNPTVITRWRKYLESAAVRYDPIWSIWHDYASLKDEEFAEKAPEVAVQWSVSGGAAAKTVHPLIRSAFNGPPPTSMTDVAKHYAEALHAIDRQWNELLAQARAAGKPEPTKLPDESAEALRQVFYGPDAPADIPRVIGWGFLTLLPDRPSQEEYKKLIKEVESWSMTGPGAPPRAMVLVDAASIAEPRVFPRGNPNRPGKEVPRIAPAVTGSHSPFHDGSGRLELANAIVARDNPLTARVIVNRIWQGHFGTGLVSTPGDFGLRGESPTHPELLDHLATELVRGGWSIKSLHRRILLSATWQQSSADREDARAIDPENRLLWRMNRRRLDFEATRDALVAATGSLDERLGGPPVDLLGAGFVPRRAIYGFIDRMNVPGLLTSFDFPNPAASSSKRDITTVAPQALYLMNGPFALDCGKRLASRSDVAAIKESNARVVRMYLLLFGRTPNDREASFAREYLGNNPTEAGWHRYAQGLLMTNEFVFVD